MKFSNRYLIYDKPKKISVVLLFKSILYPFANLFYHLIQKFSKKDKIKRNNKVAICAIFKNEARYLKEWIEFHKIIGVDVFYLYNNNSSDDYFDILKPYIDVGVVKLYQWPKNHAQMDCYKDCIKKHKYDVEWIGFIDLDEFIVPNGENDNIYSILKNFESYGAVCINWKMFGTSGKLNRASTSLITEEFIVSWPKYDEVGKCFFNTRHVFLESKLKNKILHHCLWTRSWIFNVPPVNIFKKFIIFGMNKFKSSEVPVQINHYFTKSFNEYLEKKSKGDVFFVENPHDMEYFYRHEKLNSSVDYSVYKYLIELKLKLGEK